MTPTAITVGAGPVLITDAAHQLIETHRIDLPGLIRRHTHGASGDLDRHSVIDNNPAAATGGRPHSSYEIPAANTRIWTITEPDRATTALLPRDY